MTLSLSRKSRHNFFSSQFACSLNSNSKFNMYVISYCAHTHIQVLSLDLIHTKMLWYIHFSFFIPLNLLLLQYIYFDGGTFECTYVNCWKFEEYDKVQAHASLADRSLKNRKHILFVIRLFFWREWCVVCWHQKQQQKTTEIQKLSTHLILFQKQMRALAFQLFYLLPLLRFHRKFMHGYFSEAFYSVWEKEKWIEKYLMIKWANHRDDKRSLLSQNFVAVILLLIFTVIYIYEELRTKERCIKWWN